MKVKKKWLMMNDKKLLMQKENIAMGKQYGLAALSYKYIINFFQGAIYES